MKKRTMLLLASGMLMLTLAFKPFSVQDSGKVDSNVYKLMEAVYLWELLDADYEPIRERDDTWLDVGFRSKYGMAKKYASIQMIETAFGVPVFTKGPHSNGMNFNTNKSFGHYNPKFISKVGNTFNKAMKNPLFRRAARKVYKQYFASMAKTYKESYLYLQSKPDYLAGLQKQYNGMLSSPNGVNNMTIQEEFRDFAEKLEREKGADVYEAFTAPAFWLRRSIDGTGPEIYKLLETMMARMEKAKKN